MSLHARTEFSFTVDLPYESAAPLFGAWEEQKWAAGWAPEFLHPSPPADQVGAVFRVALPPADSSVWVTTVFDLAAGHIQYVNVLNNAVVTRIDIKISATGNYATEVSVVYERTALSSDAAERVQTLALSDSTKGPEWQAEINAYAQTLRSLVTRPTSTHSTT